MKFEAGIAWEIRGGEIYSNMQNFYVLHRWTPCMLGRVYALYTSRAGDGKGRAAVCRSISRNWNSEWRETSIRYSILQLNHHRFAVFEGDGERTFAQGAAALPNTSFRQPVSVATPSSSPAASRSMSSAVGDQTRGDSRILCAQSQQGLEQIDCRGRRFVPVAFAFGQIGDFRRRGILAFDDRFQQRTPHTRGSKAFRHRADALQCLRPIGRL